MQRRLAEVIALLEGDELTAEEQAKARKTLQDIVTQLRNARPAATRRTAPAPEGGAVDGRAAEGFETRRLRATSGERGATVAEEGEETPKARRAKAPEGQRWIYPAEGEPPAIATAPKAPKPPKEGKADAKRFRAVAPAAPPTPETPKARRAHVGYGPAERDAAAKAYTDATKAYGEARRVYAEQEAQARRVYTGPGLEYGEQLRTSVARARDDAARAAAGADEARAHAEGMRGRLGVGVDTAPVGAGARLPSRARAADADESEIRAMIDEMRKEMREIRSLMQRIRQQANDEDEENDEGDENETPHSWSYPAPGLPSFTLPGQPPAPGQLSFPAPGQPPAQAPGQPSLPSPGLPPAELPGQPPVPGPFSSLGGGGDNPRQ